MLPQQDEVTISASAGHNQISLGAGDDRLTLQGSVTSGSSGTISGGTGSDIVLINGGSSDLSAFTFDSIERMELAEQGIYTFASGAIDVDVAAPNGSFVLEKVDQKLTDALGNFSTSSAAVGISGSDFDDLITGSAFDDLLLEMRGMITFPVATAVNSGNGDDPLSGGGGNDTIYAGPGTNRVYGGDGGDHRP